MSRRWLDAQYEDTGGRHRTAPAWRRSATAVTTVATLALGMLSLGAPAQAAIVAPMAAGNPGVPSDPVQLYSENFQNGPVDGAVAITGYEASSGATYSADPIYEDPRLCNGLVFGHAVTDDALAAAEFCGELTSWWPSARTFPAAFGQFRGMADPDQNLAVAEQTVTEGAPDYSGTMLRGAGIAVPEGGRFVTFALDVADHCAPGSARSLNRFYLMDGDTPIALNSTDYTLCDDPDRQSFLVDGRSVQVGTFTGDEAALVTSASIGFRLDNGQASGSGNDQAFDNFVVLDATPQLDKSFATTDASTYEPVPLTFTVTNTSELATKNGWAFTDTLSSGLTVAGDPGIVTTCTADVTAVPGSGTIAVTGGSLPAGTASCSITVNVIATAPGAYVNGSENITTLTGLNPPASSTVQVTEPERFTCEANAPGYLFQGFQPAVAYEVDLVTGEVGTVNDNVYDGGVNAVGYNVTDGYVYGWYRNEGDSGIARVDGAGNVTLLGRPAEMTEDARHIGDVDTDGHYWITGRVPWGTAEQNTWYEVDLNPQSATYLEVLDSGAISGTGIEDVYFADWAHVPGAGDYLWTVAVEPWPSGAYTLYRFDTATKELERAMTGDFGDLGDTDGKSGVGAVYADPDGHLYASVNETGAIYRIDVTAAEPTAELFTQGPSSDQNDGARCALSPIYTDFGDAPGSYGTLLADDGPRHGLKGLDPATGAAPLMLGGSVDHETDGAPGAGADGDGADEDGVTQPIVVSTLTDTTVMVGATNDTDQPAVLAGWIDLDGSGTFDTGELVQVPVPAGSGAATYELAFGVATTTEDTYARFRLFPEGAEIAPAGPASAGEVEDHLVTVDDRSFQITKTSDAEGVVQAGDTVKYTVTLTNTGSGDFTSEGPAGMTDDLTDVLDDAAYAGDAEAVASDGSDVPAPALDGAVLKWSGPISAGESVTITYSVTVTNSGDHDLVNVAVPQCPTGAACPDPTPPVTIPLPHVVPAKSSDPASGESVVAEQVIVYTVTFTNDGQAAGPVDATDDLSDVLDDAELTGEPVLDAAHADTITSVFDPDEQIIRTTGDLAAGETATVTYEVTVGADGERGDNILMNVVVPDTPPYVPAPDCDDCEPFDPPATEHPVGELTDWKTVDPASGSTVQAGREVVYTLHFENTGEAAVDVDREDVLSGVLDDAALTEDPAVSDDALTVTAPADGRFRVTGTLEPGEHVTVQYTVTVNPDGERGDDNLFNALVDPGEEPPAPAECLSGEFPDCTINAVSAVVASKSSDPASGTDVGTGERVTYTLTFENVSRNPDAADAEIAYTDHLAGVLDDADLTSGPVSSSDSVTARLDGDVIAISGAIPTGETVTVVYTVTVRAYDAQRDHSLGNVLATAGEPPVCATGSELCTQHDTIKPPPGLAATGGMVAWTVVWAALLLIAGGGAILMIRRRRGAGEEVVAEID